MSIHYKETKNGFEFGDVKITRMIASEKKEQIILIIETSKQKPIQIYVTKTGKLKIYSEYGEWRPEESR